MSRLFNAAYEALAALQQGRDAYLADLAAQQQTPIPSVYTYQGTAPNGFARVSKDGSPPYEIGRQISTGSIRIGEPVAVLGSDNLYRVVGRPHIPPASGGRPTTPRFFDVFWVFVRQTRDSPLSFEGITELIFMFKSLSFEIRFRAWIPIYYRSIIVRDSSARFEVIEEILPPEMRIRTVIFSNGRFSQASSIERPIEGDAFLYSFPPRYPYLEPWSVEFVETSPPLEDYDWSPYSLPPSGAFTGKTRSGINVSGTRPPCPSGYRLSFYGIYRASRLRV